MISNKVVYHFVGFAFHAQTSQDTVEKILKSFRDLESKIPLILDFRSGLNNSPEGLNKGCTYGFILTFRSEIERDQYLIHPDHKAFVSLVKNHLSEVFVFDFSDLAMKKD